MQLKNRNFENVTGYDYNQTFTNESNLTLNNP